MQGGSEQRRESKAGRETCSAHVSPLLPDLSSSPVQGSDITAMKTKPLILTMFMLDFKFASSHPCGA